MTVWQDLMSWFREGGFRPIMWSCVTLVLAAATYLLLRRTVQSTHAERSVTKNRLRLLGLGMLIVVMAAMMRIWTTWTLQSPDQPPAYGIRVLLQNALWTCVAAAVIYIMSRALQRTLIKGVVEIEVRHRLRLSISWAGVLVFVIAAGFIWAGSIQNLGVFLGILGAGVALSLQETLLCIAGWVLLVVRRPFDIGDRIEIDGRIGDVIGISVFQTSLLEVRNWIKADQSTGRMLIIPNSMLFRHPLYNYSKGFPFVWDELSIIVTFESDWHVAEKLMLEKAEVETDKIESQVKRQIEDMQARYAIHYEQLGPIVYVSIAENGVELTLRYLCPVRERRPISHRISRNVLEAFLAHPQIDFAYATTRIFRNTEEGKSDIGGPSAGAIQDGKHGGFT